MSYRILVEGGHAFKLYKADWDDEEDELRLTNPYDEYHNTVECIRCGVYQCTSCRKEVLEEQCPGLDGFLPGLGYEEFQ